jgi:hypothetical protein
MKKLAQLVMISVIASTVLLMSGCAVNPHARHQKTYGPPAHAPAHGYRHKQHGHDLVYDSGLGVYLVLGMPNFYFFNNHYYKYNNDRWYYSTEPNSNWRDYREDKLPPGLANKYHHGKKDHGKHKGKNKDKGKHKNKNKHDH